MILSRHRLRLVTLNLILVAIACVVSLLAAEITLRFAAHRLLRGGEWLAVGQIFKKADPPVGFSLEPDSTQLLVSGGAYTARARINSRGLRDVEHTLQKSPGAKRILVLGDSFMFGQGVEMDQNMPRRLAALMPDAEIINTGTPGYDLGQEYLYYKDRGYRYGAGVVLLAFFINDLARARELDVSSGPEGLPVSYQRSGQMLQRDREGKPRGFSGAVSTWLRAHSILYVLVRRRTEKLFAGEIAVPANKDRGAESEAETPYLDAFRASPQADPPSDWRRAYLILDELRRVVTEHEARLVVVLVPAPFQISPENWKSWTASVGVDGSTLDRAAPQKMVSAWCERSATPCHDLLTDFERNHSAALFFPWDLHWSAAGHALAARSVAGFLQAHALP